MKGDVLALPFDQYQRYRLAADILRQLRGKGAALTILDVGGRTAVLREFLKDARITLVDVEPSDAAGLVLGDGAKLPFKDGAFDAVCAFDTLEHVPPQFRAAFVSECRRVARRWLVLVGPYDTPRVAEGERLLQRFLAEKLGEAHRYLGEHLANGLPDLGRTEQQLKQLGARTLSIGHGNIDRWLVLQCLSMYMDYDPALRELGRDFQRFYNAALYASDHAEPVYRHVLCAAFGDAPLPTREGLLAEPVAPRGALTQTFDLAAELVHFDRERSTWRKEREVLFGSVHELEQDLDGHRRKTAELERERGAKAAEVAGARGEFQKALADVERDLQGHRKALKDVHELLDGHRAALQLARDEIEQLRALHGHSETEYRAVLADRDAHRSTATDLQQRLLDEQRQGGLARAALEHDLAGHRDALGALHADLAGHKKLVTQLRAEVAHARSEYEAVSAEVAQLRANAEVLTADLAGQRKHAETLARELVAARAYGAALYEQSQAQRARAEVLAADLEGHRTSLTTLTADLDGHRRVLAEQAQRIAKHASDYAALAEAHNALHSQHTALDLVRARLESELAAERARRVDVEGALARSDAELRKTLAFASGIEGSLAQRELVYDELRKQLRSRWRNFVRVFRPNG